MKSLSLLLGVIAVSACSTAHDQSTSGVQSLPPASYAEASLMALEGKAAESAFEAMKVEGQHDGGYFTTKKADGELRCVVRTPWDAPAHHECSLGEVLALEGDAAAAMYEAFKVEGVSDGAYHITKSATGTLTCRLKTPWGAPASYGCAFDRQPATPAAKLELAGDSAKKAYENLKVTAKHDGGYHTTKKLAGELVCSQRVTMGAPAAYNCAMKSKFKLSGADAQAMYEAFNVEGKHDGAYHTFKKAKGTLSCVLRTPMGGPSSYRCQLAD